MTSLFDNPEEYKSFSRVQKAIAQKMLEQCVLDGNETVLDVGCGDGNITVDIAKRVPNGQVAGIDLSFEMVDYCKQHRLNQLNVTFEQADICSYESDTQYDVVVAFNVLHWIKQQSKALKQIKSLLKPGGRVYFAVVRPVKYDQRISDIIHKVMQKPHWRGHFKEYKEVEQMDIARVEDYQDLLEQLGYTVKKCEETKLPFVFENRAEFSLTTYYPQAQGLQGQLKEDFMSEIVSEVLNMQGMADEAPNSEFSTVLTYWSVIAQVGVPLHI